MAFKIRPARARRLSTRYSLDMAVDRDKDSKVRGVVVVLHGARTGSRGRSQICSPRNFGMGLDMDAYRCVGNWNFDRLTRLPVRAHSSCICAGNPVSFRTDQAHSSVERLVQHDEQV